MLEFFASAARFGSEMAGVVQHVTSSNRCINTSEMDYTARTRVFRTIDWQNRVREMSRIAKLYRESPMAVLHQVPPSQCERRRRV